MGKGGSAKQVINEYYMSMHYGIATELDAVTGIVVGEKEAWVGNQATEGAITVYKPDLFGGQKKEGGIGGVAYYLPGSPTQVLPDGLAARRGLTSTTSPAYRGLATMYFIGNGGVASRTGFWWGNTPYLQGVWIRGRRAPKGLDPDYAMIGNQYEVATDGYTVTTGGATLELDDGVPALVGGHTVSITITSEEEIKTIVIDGLEIVITPYVLDEEDEQQPGTTVSVGGTEGVLVGDTIIISGVSVTVYGDSVNIAAGSTGQDANPAHIIYEAMTNGSWGMDGDPSLFDSEAYEACGRVLFNEGFGMSMLWTREAPIETFVSEVLDHIQAAQYVDPDTGKMTLKLFRNDYSPTTLPIISPDNAVLDNYQRKLWGETVNEITVTWTNPVNEQEETVTQQDLGNVVVQGSTVSNSRNYYGIRNAALATKVAQRDVRQSSAPLASVEALLDRRSWNLKPGSVVRLTWPEYEIANLVMRVTNIDYGKVGSPSIVVSLLEDIFSLEDAAYLGSADGGFVDPAQEPDPMDHVKIITAPAYFSSRRLSAADLGALEYPEALAAILGGSSNGDASFYELIGQVVLPNGTTASERRGTKGLLGWKLTQAVLPDEAVTVVDTFGTITNGIGPTVSGFVFIGDGTEKTMEIALLQSFEEGVGWTLQRGVLDTVPRRWPIGTSIWFYDVRNDFFDQDIHSEGESVDYKLLTITSLGTLPIEDSPVYGTVLTGRPFLPNRPGDVKIEGSGFGTLDLSGTPPTTLNITWANRNRTMEENAVVHWTDATVTPETGQTTAIRATKTSDGTVLTTITGLTGTSYALDVATVFGAEIEADLYIFSQRDGLDSLQGVLRRVRVAPDPGDPGGTPTDPGDPVDPPYVPPEDYPDPWRPPNWRNPDEVEP